ncbi:ALG14, UDP-N-acetylglucosaminyltransferase subunit [Arctopsyche grandis]|uniref:ALG14, UDP-N-acetylglucosaminyltransferase subunit n=1 Tax=Arctopsyche grandis TaxID=121162 RepID=UPI00406D7E93
MLLYFGIVIGTISVVYVFWQKNKTQTHKPRVKNVRTIICVGSGGHTAEMMRILKKMSPEKYSPRMYILASDDTTSEIKVLNFEKELNSNQTEYSLSKIYRSRKVGQSYVASIFTTLYALCTSVPVVFRFRPEVIICNGPGTCVPICAIAVFMRCLCLIDCKIVFVESVCRVKSLSLSGRILMKVADVFAVQWQELSNTYSNALYFGKLS